MAHSEQIQRQPQALIERVVMVQVSTRRRDHGAFHSSPTNGSAKNTMATTARRVPEPGGAPSPTRLTDGDRSDRRAWPRRSTAAEAVLRQDRLARGTGDEVDERLSGGRIRCLFGHRNRVLGEHVDVGRDVHACSLVTSRLHVGFVDDAGISLAQGHLRHDALHVLLQAHRSNGHPGALEDLRGVLAAWHLGRA